MSILSWFSANALDSIADDGTTFASGTQYTFQAELGLPDYTRYMLQPGVSFDSIRRAVAAALSRDGSQADVPACEGATGWGSGGNLLMRVNYRPVQNRGTVAVGTIIRDAARSLAPAIAPEYRPVPNTGWIPFTAGYVVDPSTVAAGRTSTDAPDQLPVARIHSDDPARNNELGIMPPVQRATGPNVTLIVAGAVGLIGLVAFGYSAGKIAQLVTAVKE